MKYDEKLGSGFVIVVIITVTIFTGCVEESPMSTPTPTAMPPIENGKGRIVFNYKILPEKVIIREIKDDFLLGVGTVDNKSSVSSTVLKDLRINGVNYFLPSITWPAIEVREGYYYGTPRPGMESITWLDKSGAVLNGHCFLFFMNDEGMVPSFAFNRSFEEQKKLIEKYVKSTVTRFPNVNIWTLNEPIAQNCFGWSREQVYDVFVSASKWIHEANPEAKVMINMIPIKCNWSGLDYDPDEVLNDLIDRGLEADIIGIELYYWWAEEEYRDENGYPTIDWVKGRVDIFRKYNLPIIFSEVGVPGVIDGREQFDKQADWMEAFLKFCHEDDDVVGAVWYFVRDDKFMPYAGLMNDDYTYRPIAERLIKIANEWNPSKTHYLSQNYLDLDPGKYDIIVKQEIFSVSVAEGQAVMIKGEG